MKLRRCNWRKLFRDKAGATAIEYALIVALIAVVSIAALSNFSSEFQNTLNVASGAMSKGSSGA